MSILVDRNTRVLVQGITGNAGRFHTEEMLEYGTRIVAGVTPGRGGSRFRDDIPVFDTVERAVRDTGATASVLFVPPAFAADAVMEAADAGILLVVVITEGIPTADMIRVKRYLEDRPETRLLGPNCPGVMPGSIHRPGRIGVVSRSGTLTYEAVAQLSALGMGQSTAIGIGGDPVHGISFGECLSQFESDPQTDAIVLIGEIGGTEEEQTAAHIKKNISKPVVGFIAGRTAPPGKRMGHAGAVISGETGKAATKIAALRDAGVTMCDGPHRLGQTVQKRLSGE